MLLDIRKLSHQKQTEKHNCVSTCLSIVTGHDEEGIAREMELDGFSKPFNQKAAYRYLTRHNIHSSRLSHGVFIDDSIYLISCASPKSPKAAHMIVGYVHECCMRIIDPADDLETEQFYSSTDFSENMIPCFEYYLLEDCSM